MNENEKEHFPCENLLLAITGSVAASNMPLYVSALRSKFARNIYIMISKAAEQFVSPYTMELLSGHGVFRELTDNRENFHVPHMELTKKADMILIMPSTANVMGKAANGIGDDLISTSIMASGSKPVVFVPAMNETMWFNKAVQCNLKRLKEFGYFIVEPGYGIEVSDHKLSYGAFPPLGEIFTQIVEILKNFKRE